MKSYLAAFFAVTLSSCCNFGGENYCFSDYAPIESVESGKLVTMPGYGESYIVMDGRILVRVEEYNNLFKTSKKYTWSEEDKNILMEQVGKGANNKKI